MPIVLDVTAEKEAEIRAKAQAAGYGTPADYVLSLIGVGPAVDDRYDEDADEGPPSQRGGGGEDFAQLLSARVRSGDFIEVTDEYFGELRKRLLGGTAGPREQ